MGETWVQDIRTWPAPRPEDDGVSLLAATLHDVVGAKGRVGVPMGHETHLRMPLIDWERLKKMTSDILYIDATNVVRSLRMRKSELEIAKMAHVCRGGSGHPSTWYHDIRPMGGHGEGA